MPHYSTDDSLRDARSRYFSIAGFDNGGYDERWVRLKAGPLTLKFPNTAARVRAVKLHDLHHVLTEYDTSWTGEAEIGAWEIASGCGRHYPAWILNFGAFAIGLAVAPGRIYRAFIRGRHSKNFYPSVFREGLDYRVGDLRKELSISFDGTVASPLDRAMFVLWSVGALAFTIAPYVLALAALVLIIRR